MLTDSHAHLEMLDGVSEIIGRAKDAGVGRIISISSNVESSERTVRIAEEFAEVLASVGIHPHEAATFSEGALARLESLAESPKVVAIGESGLDYHHMSSPKEAQILSFRNHIALAKRRDLALVVHARDSGNGDAHGEAQRILAEENIRGMRVVIHCFTADLQAAERYIELGCYISFSGIITFKNAEEIRQAAAQAPMDRILIETDSPYLAPIPYRGKRNEPAFVQYVAGAIAQIRGISLDEVSRLTTANAERFFAIGADRSG
ncbi:MAG: TatD family hydrolase [Deltaproteobacteria bacterium]